MPRTPPTSPASTPGSSRGRHAAAGKGARVAAIHRHRLHRRQVRSNAMQTWQRLGVHLSVWTLLVTGVEWLSVHFLAWPAVSRAAVSGLPSPWEPWLMKLHGAATMAMLFFLGSLAATHVIRGWRLRERRSSGIGMLAGAAALVASAYALYYVVPDELRNAVGLAHAVVGAGWGSLLWWHRRVARR